MFVRELGENPRVGPTYTPDTALKPKLVLRKVLLKLSGYGGSREFCTACDEDSRH
jgi:hypothetical protein